MTLTILVPRTNAIAGAGAGPRMMSPRAASSSTAVTVAATTTESPVSTAHAVDVVRAVIALHGEGACPSDPVESATEWRLDVKAPFDVETTVPKLKKVAPGLVFEPKEGEGEVGTLVFPKTFKSWATAFDVALMVAMAVACMAFVVLKGREGMYDFVRY